MAVRSPDPLAALYDEHALALFRFLLRVTRAESTTKDILQEVFIRLARQPDLLKGVAAPRSYLFRMAHRLAIDHARREQTHAHYAQNASEEGEVSILPPPSDADAAWRCEQLTAGLAELPHDQRAVIALKVWEGLTFSEIGEALEISPDTAASRYRYGVNKLRNLLRPLHDDLR